MDSQTRFRLACEQVVTRIASENIRSKAVLDQVKREASKSFGRPMMLNSDLVFTARRLGFPVSPVLLRKPTRSLSGVAVVAVMTPPRGCVAACSFCPSSQIGVPTPKSYTGKEPSTRRSLSMGFNPFQVIRARLDQLEALGHKTDKVELILQGGTLPAEPLAHQQFVVKRCLEAFAGRACDTLSQAKALCETSPHRLVGFTIETRPDWCTDDDIQRFLDWGVTRVELGVQLPDDAVYAATRRGHSVADVIDATKRLRDAGLKVGYHLMPGQPGSSPKNDLEKMKMVFSDERFLPDLVKFYPCLVVPGTALYRDWKAGNFEPLSTERAAAILGEIAPSIPVFTRVMRIQRDIPADLIAGGVTKGNLRELVDDYMRAHGLACRCIRCREAGLVSRTKKVGEESLRLSRLDYAAAGGDEVFLSLENPATDTLFALCRLRRIGSSARAPLEAGMGMIRELRVFSRAVGLHEAASDGEFQHKGLGARLLAEAERIAFDEWHVPQLAVISGLGVREYYRNLGYSDFGPFVSKSRVS